jgi:hypothetical protein
MTTVEQSEPRDPSNPVWDVYDLYRTARLNVKYYCGRLRLRERQNFVIEIVIAATASGSAIAGFTFWTSGLGRIVWQTLSVIAAVLAVTKPLLKLPEKIRQLEETISGFRTLEHDLRKIEISIRQERQFTKDHRTRFNAALERMNDLVSKPAELSEDKRLKRECQAEVVRELPASRFYVPVENE